MPVSNKEKRNYIKPAALLLVLIFAVSAFTFAWYTTSIAAGLSLTMGDLAVEFVKSELVSDDTGDITEPHYLEPANYVSCLVTLKNTGNLPAALLISPDEGMAVKAELVSNRAGFRFGDDESKYVFGGKTWGIWETTPSMYVKSGEMPNSDYTAGTSNYPGFPGAADSEMPGSSHFFSLSLDEDYLQTNGCAWDEAAGYMWYSLPDARYLAIIPVGKEIIMPVRIDATKYVDNPYQYGNLEIAPDMDHSWNVSQVLPGAIASLYINSGSADVANIGRTIEALGMSAVDYTVLGTPLDNIIITYDATDPDDILEIQTPDPVSANITARVDKLLQRQISPGKPDLNPAD
ncbi:MAG: hypothetical protein LBC56_00755 [Oscillospiraceae bacterium]|nr:hypothetical protein [Oscillospiraceae bacterium]